VLVMIACKVVKDDEVEEEVYPELAALDPKLMISPAVALGEVAKVAATMAVTAKENIGRGLSQFKEYKEELSEEIEVNETRLDCFTDRADSYLIELSSNIENEVDNRQRNMLMQCIRDIERIGDYATNFDEMAKKLHDSECEFSKVAWKELDTISDAIEEIMRLTVEALDTDNEYIAFRIEPLEEVIDDMVLLLKNRHADRLCEGTCSINAGLIFMDILTYLERTADQCSNIAMLILGKKNEEIMKNHHSYLHKLHATGDKSYLAEQENRREQYLVPLERMK